jgi:acetyltransferase-like isoleucine patch superfamily enzyme
MSWIKHTQYLAIIEGANVEAHIVSKQGRVSRINWGSSLSGDIEIGQGVIIGINCTITSSVHGIAKGIPVTAQKTIHKKIIIGDDVFIGSGAVILGGNIIHSGAVIGAGSVLTEDNEVGENEVWVGNPCKFLKYRT